MSALIDPKPGDVVKASDGVTRTVTSVQGGDINYRDSRCATTRERNCWISTWREWCRKNEAIEVTE
jgi:hypothetical protein